MSVKSFNFFGQVGRSVFNIKRLGIIHYVQNPVRQSLEYLKNINVKNLSTSETHLCSGQSKKIKKVFIQKDGTEVKKKIDSTPKIWLIDLKNKRTVVHLDEAMKIARRNNLELVKEDNIDNEKMVYRLVKVGLINDQSHVSNSAIEKTLVIGSNIQEHDLGIKIGQAIKLLKKGKNLRIIVDGNQNDKQDNIVKLIETKITPNTCKITKIAKKEKIILALKPCVEKLKEDDS